MDTPLLACFVTSASLWIPIFMRMGPKLGRAQASCDSPDQNVDDDDYDDPGHDHSSNDDRSDSMNPNNDSYQASMDNRSDQMNPKGRNSKYKTLNSKKLPWRGATREGMKMIDSYASRRWFDRLTMSGAVGMALSGHFLGKSQIQNSKWGEKTPTPPSAEGWL